MTTLNTRDFEEGTNGNTVVDSDGWVVFTTFVYDGTTSSHGSMSAKAGTSFGSMNYDVSALSSWRLRFYIRRGTETQTGHLFLVDLLDGGGAYLADFQLRNEGGGTLRNRWNYNTDFEQAAASFPTEEWTRIDYEYTGVSSAVNVYIYDPLDDTSITETLTVTSSATVVDKLRMGVIQSGGVSFNYDSLAITDGTDPGPADPGLPAVAGWTVIIGGVEVDSDAINVIHNGSEVTTDSFGVLGATIYDLFNSFDGQTAGPATVANSGASGSAFSATSGDISYSTDGKDSGMGIEATDLASTSGARFEFSAEDDTKAAVGTWIKQRTALMDKGRRLVDFRSDTDATMYGLLSVAATPGAVRAMHGSSGVVASQSPVLTLDEWYWVTIGIDSTTGETNFEIYDDTNTLFHSWSGTYGSATGEPCRLTRWIRPLSASNDDMVYDRCTYQTGSANPIPPR